MKQGTFQHKINKALEGQEVVCESEIEVINIAQHLRTNGYDMDLIEIDLNKFKVWKK